MSLLSYFKVKYLALPSSSTRAYSSLSRKDLEHANREVKCALAGENTSKKVATP